MEDASRICIKSLLKSFSIVVMQVQMFGLASHKMLARMSQLIRSVIRFLCFSTAVINKMSNKIKKNAKFEASKKNFFPPVLKVRDSDQVFPSLFRIRRHFPDF